MSMYTKLVSNIIFPLHEKIKGHNTIQIHEQMEQSQWLSSGELQALQFENLRKFLCDIAEHVPYYQNLFSGLNFDPANLESITDLQKLPFLDKPEIRANMEAMKALNATHLQRFNTGGSSGEPLIFYLGKNRVSHDVAAKRRATRWWGVDIGDPEIVIWGSPIELGSQDRIRLIRDKLFRTELFSAFEMSNESLDTFIKNIKHKKPKMLFGYPSSLALIAEHAQKNSSSLDSLGIKVVFVTSERLYDYQREQIEKTFGCPVANGYGGRDAGFIAHQCPSGSMHITSEDIVVEIIDAEGNVLPAGQSGEITVTHLATREFPFVRYRTGDIGVLSDEACACGRGLPVLKSIEGRTTDFVVAQDGTIVHGLALIYVLRDIHDVQSFKIIQESLDQIRVQLVVGAEYDTATEQLIIDTFRQRLGDSISVEFSYVADIPREKSGKYRYIVSHVTR